MTTPDSQPPAEERPEPAKASTGPTVTTAPPPRAGRRWSRLPSHVGPARTSTLVLAVLFVGIFVLWLYVRPPATATAAPGGTGTSAGTGQQTTQQPTRARTPTPTPTPTATPTTATHTSSTPPTGATTTGTHTSTGTPTQTSGSPGQTTGGSSLPSLPTTASAPTS